MSAEWTVYNFYVNSTELFDEIAKELSLHSKVLIKSGHLDGFYYNRYDFPPTPPYLRFGCHNLKEEEKLMNKVMQLIDQGKIIESETFKPDLTDVDGVAMDYIKLTVRKITETIKDDFNKPFTTKQAAYLIHLFMNNFFGYEEEKEIYSGLAKSMKKAIEKAKLAWSH